jgi:hypothetical protein
METNICACGAKAQKRSRARESIKAGKATLSRSIQTVHYPRDSARCVFTRAGQADYADLSQLRFMTKNADMQCLLRALQNMVEFLYRQSRIDRAKSVGGPQCSKLRIGLRS